MHKGSTKPLETYTSEVEKKNLHQNYNGKIAKIKRIEDYSGNTMNTYIKNTIQLHKNNDTFFPSIPGVDAEGRDNGVFNEAQSLSPKFRDGARAAAIKVGQSGLQGPHQIEKVFVAPTDRYEGPLREGELEPRRDRKSTRLNSSHVSQSRMPSSA